MNIMLIKLFPPNPYSASILLGLCIAFLNQVGSSPSHESNTSDWEMSDSMVQEKERNPQVSPLPNFEQLCGFNFGE